jgi:hypothetical protein
MIRRRLQDFANVVDFGVPWLHPIGPISQRDRSVRSEINDHFGSAIFTVNVAGFMVFRIDSKDASAEPYAAHPKNIT